MKKSIGLTIIGWALIILGSISCMQFIRQVPGQVSMAVLYYVTYSLMLVFVGVGILRLKNIARILRIYLSIIKTVDILLRSKDYLAEEATRLIGIVDILGIFIFTAFIIWFLNRKSIKLQFKSYKPSP